MNGTFFQYEIADHPGDRRGTGVGIAAVQLAALGVMGDILAGVRTLQQRTLERVRRVELQLGVEPSHYEPGAAGPYGRAADKPDREPVEL